MPVTAGCETPSMAYTNDHGAVPVKLTDNVLVAADPHTVLSPDNVAVGIVPIVIVAVPDTVAGQAETLPSLAETKE